MLSKQNNKNVQIISSFSHFFFRRVNRHDTDESLRGATNVRHKIVVMGGAKVGKTSLINQFLYNRFSPKYKRTVEEMHQGTFSISGVSLTLDILDTSGAYEVSDSPPICIPHEFKTFSEIDSCESYPLLVPFGAFGDSGALCVLRFHRLPFAHQSGYDESHRSEFITADIR